MGYVDGDSLLIRIQVAFGADVTADPAGWSWTDITSYWHAPDDISIVWGRSPGAEQAETHTLSLTLKNSDGRFSAFYPMSPYYPHVVQWTPITVDIDLGDGEGWRRRYSGFVRKWPTTWPRGSGLFSLVTIDAVGVLGRLQRGKPPEYSPIRRDIGASGVVAYWPVEDGGAAGQAASAIPGHPPLAITGPIGLDTAQDLVLTGWAIRYGTRAVADLSAGGTLSGVVQAAVTTATASAWTVAAAVELADLSLTSGDLVLIEVDTPGGTYATWRLVLVKATFHTQVVAVTAEGATTTVIDAPGVIGSFGLEGISVWQDGGSIRAGWGYSAYTGVHAVTGSVSGALSGVTRVTVNANGVTASIPLLAGHISLWALPAPPLRGNELDPYGVGYDAAFTSWLGEAAHLRLARLAGEDGLAITMPDVVDDLAVARSGWQPVGDSISLYQLAADTDGGLLYEEGFGLAYLPRAARYNPAVALTIDGALGQLGGDFAPLADDQLLRNRVTVERMGGSSWVAEDAESIAASGAVDTSARLSLADDSRLRDQAGWRLHLLTATAREPRYGAISLALHAGARQLAADWCEARPGSMVRVVNPPAQAPPGPVDQIVVGASERFTRTTWRVSMQTEPASPWVVAEADGDPRAPADGSTLAADLADGAMTLSLASTAANRPWTTDPADMPLDVRVGGERITVSAITGSTSPQTATITARGVNGVTRSWPAGTAVDVWDPAIAPL